MYLTIVGKSVRHGGFVVPLRLYAPSEATFAAGVEVERHHRPHPSLRCVVCHGVGRQGGWYDLGRTNYSLLPT